MIAVRVQYTVRPDYADTNAANIQAVMDELQTLGRPGIRYSAFTLADGVTFVHFAMFASKEDQAVLGQTAAFPKFQTALKASGLVSPPDAQPLTAVGASWEVF